MRELAAAAVREVPVFFPAGDDQVFGVMAVPPGPARGTGVITLTGGASIVGIDRNRMYVRLARKLADRGFHALRFDYHGVGESLGKAQYDLEEPFVEDLQGAINVMRAAGLRRLVLIGSCFGTRTILAAAAQVPELAAVVLIATPIGDSLLSDRYRLPLDVARKKTLGELARMAFRPKTLRNLIAPSKRASRLRIRQVYLRTVAVKAQLMLDSVTGQHGRLNESQRYLSSASDRFAAGLRKTVERGAPILFLYGQDDGFYKEFSKARQESLRSVFERAPGRLDVQTVDGILHGFRSIRVQDAALERTIAWLERVLPA